MRELAVRLRGVGMHYPGPPEVHALDQVSLDVRRGEYVAIVGPSGSGKSTLLNVLGLLDRAACGTYELDGADVSALTEAGRAALRCQRIGFVFQAFHLLHRRSAMENVLLASLYRPQSLSDRERREQARAVLEQVGLGNRLDAAAETLSGGECQRVAIARALVNRPTLLLCDEPTGNLDSENSARVMSLLEQMHGSGQTIITITHDSSVAARAQRRVVIDDGHLSEQD